ncbi:MAG: hypothetical protein R3C56_22925 [Pirellulaceae bacterium]
MTSYNDAGQVDGQTDYIGVDSRRPSLDRLNGLLLGVSDDARRDRVVAVIVGIVQTGAIPGLLSASRASRRALGRDAF